LLEELVEAEATVLEVAVLEAFYMGHILWDLQM
jgi:hypothetical protein